MGRSRNKVGNASEFSHIPDYKMVNTLYEQNDLSVSMVEEGSVQRRRERYINLEDGLSSPARLYFTALEKLPNAVN